ncbi:MAG: hypothetical protein AAB368_16055, partial [bacterium]
IFLTLSTTAVGVFVQALKGQRTLVHLMSIDNNASAALEQVSRDIRTGVRFCEESYRPPIAPCNLTAEEFTFVNFEGVTTTYARTVDAGRGTLVKMTEEQGTVPLTGPDVDVSRLHFTVRQGDGSYCDPWRVTAYLEVKSPDTRVTAQAVRLQTTVSARTFPVEAPGVPEQVFRNC